jgi:PAS domain-containing protein
MTEESGRHDILRRLEREVASYQVITHRLDLYTQELEQQLRQVRQERELGQAILDAVPDPVLAVDGNGHILRCNARARRLFNLPEQPIIDCLPAVRCHRCFGDACPLQAGSTIAHERQVEITGPDGTHHIFAITAMPLPGAVAQYLFFFRDITEYLTCADQKSSSPSTLMGKGSRS